MNHYEVLGIDRTATHDQVVSAFRKKALMYHPDLNPSPGAKEMFIKAHQAFEVLSNSERRSAYDYSHSKAQPKSQTRQEPQDYPYRRANGYYDAEYTPSSSTPPPDPRAPRWKVFAPIPAFGAIIGIIYVITEIVKALGWQ